MTAISLRFISGRYHATPWGRHVNEGAVEWPPSPWRIHRALVAVWKRTLPEVAESDVKAILVTLAGELPEFVLPPASTGHTRHYMPWFKKGPDDRTLVFDAFVALRKDVPILIRWPNASLDRMQRELLVRLLANLNTLGRSESWCEAALLDDGDARQIRAQGAAHGSQPTVPLNGDAPLGEHEIVRLLCPDPRSAFGDDCVVAGTPPTSGRGRQKKRVETTSTIYDPAWNICIETLQLHRERWSDPPGSRWVSYVRPRDCFKIEPAGRRRAAAGALPRLQAVRYAFDSTVLPATTEALPVAESARRHLMGIYGRWAWRHEQGDAPYPEDALLRPRSEVLSGKNAAGTPLVGHRHAYYLPADEDGDGRLDHLTIYATTGFGPGELSALDHLSRLRRGRSSEDPHPLRLLLLGMGRWEEFAGGPLGRSAVWLSATPYIATRHAKTRGPYRMDLRSPEACAAFLQDDLRAQIAAVRPDLVGIDADDATIEPLWDVHHVFRVAGRWRPIQFKRVRRKSSDDGSRRLAGAFRLTFPRPVQGPLALGWSSHFGMGLFLPSPMK